MTNHTHQDDTSCSKSHCGCCGPIEFEIPEELMTPEMKKMREEMGEEAFLEMMKKML